MSLNDPIADALTRIRNAQRANHETVSLNHGKVVQAIVEILKKEGFIESFEVKTEGIKKSIEVTLRYAQGKPVIRGLDRMSSPGKRTYTTVHEIRPYLNSIGLSIYSTSKGIMTDKDALSKHVGGEYLCRVW